jgi:DNA/RNA-binding domain of Phe-tRNA-synthetase-like protein
VREKTSAVLVVAEALHDTAGPDMERLLTTLAGELEAAWAAAARTQILTASAPRFEL